MSQKKWYIIYGRPKPFLHRLPLHPNKTVILNLSLRHCCRLHVKLVICQSTCSSRQLPSHFEEKPTSSSLVHTILHTRHAGTLQGLRSEFQMTGANYYLMTLM